MQRCARVSFSCVLVVRDSNRANCSNIHRTLEVSEEFIPLRPETLRTLAGPPHNSLRSTCGLGSQPLQNCLQNLPVDHQAKHAPTCNTQKHLRLAFKSRQKLVQEPLVRIVIRFGDPYIFPTGQPNALIPLLEGASRIHFVEFESHPRVIGISIGCLWHIGRITWLFQFSWRPSDAVSQSDVSSVSQVRNRQWELHVRQRHGTTSN